MGKIKRDKKKPALASDPSLDTVTTKQRVETELQLLRLRKQDITTKNTKHKVGKLTAVKKSVKSKKQLKKVAKALAIADREETKIEKAGLKVEQRKLRKSLWD